VSLQLIRERTSECRNDDGWLELFKQLKNIVSDEIVFKKMFIVTVYFTRMIGAIRIIIAI